MTTPVIIAIITSVVAPLVTWFIHTHSASHKTPNRR